MAVPSLVLNPLQFCDQNGKPYSGGTISTFIKNTSTPKSTWKDPGQAAVNTNPVTLDSAGRCQIWADGDYQIQLNDAVGNLIFNVPASTVISAAMYPVVSAPTTLDAMNYMGVTAAIAAETTARDAAIAASAGTIEGDIATETAARIDADNGILNYTTTAVADLIAVDNAQNTAILAISGAPSPYVQGGVANLGTAGVVTINFPTTFLTACDAVVCMLADATVLTSGAYGSVTFVATAKTASSATIVAYAGTSGILTPPAPAVPPFYWIAIGR